MDYEDVKLSKFNAGIAQTERIDALQRAINAAKFNPLMKNFETGTFNFEVMISAADCLSREGWDKFSVPEREDIHKYEMLVKNWVKTFFPISFTKSGDVKSINQNHYQSFLELYDIWEKKIKILLGKHNLNAPSKDEDDDYDY
jgi:hypothetical protein